MRRLIKRVELFFSLGCVPFMHCGGKREKGKSVRGDKESLKDERVQKKVRCLKTVTLTVTLTGKNEC